MTWKKEVFFESSIQQNEVWTYNDGTSQKKYNVETRSGKRIDVTSLKSNFLKNFEKTVNHRKTTRRSAYDMKKKFPKSIVRHLDPLDHIQCFSDSSLATSFILSNYEIFSGWYYGMDIYELFSQLAYNYQNDNFLISIK